MSKRTVFTTLTPLPAGISRECVMDTLRSHTEMIDLNPLVEERHPIKPPSNATAEEYHCIWYSLTDRVNYLPGGLMSGKVSYNVCFHDLENGLQTHCYAPLGLNIKGKWSLGDSLPDEPIAPVELGVGAPLHGLWLREDIDMSCNFMMASFVKKTLKKAHAHLVDRLMIKAQIMGATQKNLTMSENTSQRLGSRTEYASSITSHGAQSIVNEEQLRTTTRSPPLSFPGAFRDGEDIYIQTQTLSAHPSPGSGQNSQRGSGGGTSYQSPVADLLALPTRTLWQNLNVSPKRSSEIGNLDQGYNQAQSCIAVQERVEEEPQRERHRSPRLSQSQNQTQTQTQTQKKGTQLLQPIKYNPATYPREFGAVELGAPLR